MLQNTSVVHTLISEVAKTPVFTGFLGVWREVQSSLAAPAHLLDVAESLEDKALLSNLTRHRARRIQRTSDAAESLAHSCVGTADSPRIWSLPGASPIDMGQRELRTALGFGLRDVSATRGSRRRFQPVQRSKRPQTACSTPSGPRADRSRQPQYLMTPNLRNASWMRSE